MQYSLIKSIKGSPVSDIRVFLGGTKNEIIIFTPYIKTLALEALALPDNVQVTIITTLRINDLWLGSTDIGLYPYCKQKGIRVFINNSIHLKAYIRDWESCIFGSSNLTNRGLATQNNYNLELNGLVEYLDFEIIIYLKKILNQSAIMTDAIYQATVDKLESIPPPEKIENFDFDIDIIEREKVYLISSLPMSVNINKLYNLVSNNYGNGTSEEINCAIHDSVLFNITSKLTYEEFKMELSENFFSSNFIKDLLLFIESDDRYFGEVKKWIQLNCESVPVPSMRDLTGNIQVLYKWIAELSDGEYVVDRPNHSERIRRKQ